jgi:hypothetical protein
MASGEALYHGGEGMIEKTALYMVNGKEREGGERERQRKKRETETKTEAERQREHQGLHILCLQDTPSMT